MMELTLEVDVLSDTAFSMGGGVSGLVDAEVKHDASGLPMISGRTLKGLLVNECAEILFALPADQHADWEAAARRLFGERGETTDKAGGVWIGDATLAPDLVAHIHAADDLSAQDVLESLTSVRTQTAISDKGAPKDETLRSIRVIESGFTFYAPLRLQESPDSDTSRTDKALLAACVKALRRAGLGRTRGKGKLVARLTDRPLEPKPFADQKDQPQDLTLGWFKTFKEKLA
jgi:CRISPR/Cas system CSM-associated protein Csm3 (group 7 of RAMP superfamily)